MDSTELRLILLVAGIILIFGIYGWEKLKRQRPRRRAGRRRASSKPERRAEPERQEPTSGVLWDDSDDFEQLEPEERLEPYVSAPPEPEPDFESEPSILWSDAPAEPKPAAAPEKAPPTVDDWLEAKSREAEFPQAVDEPPAAVQAPTKKAPRVETPPPGVSASLPPVLVIHVASRVGGQMSGDLIMSVARDINLLPGDMDILHRHDEASDEVLFSVASMVEPGTFPFANMSTFSTPGLVLFAQLPGARPALRIYDDMLEAAERLAALLDARLLDDRRRPLTREARERMREELGAGAPME